MKYTNKKILTNEERRLYELRKYNLLLLKIEDAKKLWEETKHSKYLDLCKMRIYKAKEFYKNYKQTFEYC